MVNHNKSETAADIENVSVWLVEDNLHYQRTLSELINESEEINCPRTFISCEEALEALHADEPPQVILLDNGLPGISGIEGISKFKSVSPSTYIIMLTAHEDSETVFQALCAGASGYLLKDSSPEVVIEAVKEVIAGGAPMNMQIAKKVVDMFAAFAPQKGEYGLTDREKDILKLLVDGHTKRKIADELFISFHTVNTHLKNIYSKLQVNSRSKAISKAFKEKLL